jgi:hypothetical protein
MTQDEDNTPQINTNGHIPPVPAGAITRDDLVAGLHARGLCYLAPTPHGDEKSLTDDELIAGIAHADDARLRFALAGLFLLRPDLAARAIAVEPHLPEAARQELRKQYVAAVYLQRLWRTHLRLQFGETPLIPARFIEEMDLPSPDVMHGELGLRTLCERSPYNDWSSYQQVIDLLSSQPCPGRDIIELSTNTDEGGGQSRKM